MATVTSAFQGITTPISQLYDEIHTRGWQVTKVSVKNGRFVATAKNPHGESVEKVGRDQNTALAALLMYIMRREHIRQGAWTNHWADKLEPIAQDYAKAPHFDPKAAAAWKELADDCVARAAVLSHQLAIEVTHDPEPYNSPQELWEDVQKNRHLSVSDAATEHPVWTRDQVIAFRICHDVLGHAAAGGDFGWTGENLATAAHMPYLTPNAQHALFAETVGQAAYNNYYRGRGPQKITLLKDHLSPLQDEQNPPGHGGEHPSMSLSPGVMPTRASATIKEVDTGEGNTGTYWDQRRPFIYDRNSDTIHMGDWGTHHPYIAYHAKLPDFDMQNQKYVPGWITSAPYEFGEGVGVYPKITPEEEQNLHHTLHQAYPEYVEAYNPEQAVSEPQQIDWSGSLPHLGGALRDPNYQYETNIVPPAGNAVTLFDDPLEHMKVKDQAHALDTGWSRWETADGDPDIQRMKIAVTNAFRAALLSPLKTLQWNATQYQDLSHIPHDTDDPKVYWDALEQARIHHNRSQGFPDPEVRHKAHYPALLDFYRYYARHNPHLNPSEVKSAADREVQIMQAEIEESILAKSKDVDMDIIEPKVYKELAKRLKIIVKDDKPLHQASAVENPYNPDRQAYGGFIGRHLIAIAKVSQYADILTEAALEDVKHHDGSGHTFRATALRLGIPYVGPKIVSFAWLLLQPLTSQLATVDSHMAEALGYKYKDVASNRDYFRLERELMAGRDASGYGHMPLGQFQWGLWDYKRTGPGSHQDHTPLKPYEPTPHHQISWEKPQLPANQHRPDWIAPEWWANTQPYRDAESAKWSHDVAVRYPRDQVPWQDEPVFVPHTAGDIREQTMYHVAPAHAEQAIAAHGLQTHDVAGGSYAEQSGDEAGVWLYDRHPDKEVHYLPGHEHVYEVDVTGLPLEHGWGDQSINAYRSAQPIEASRLRRVARTADDGTDEVHLALEVPEWIRKKIAEFVGTLNITPHELVDPNEYHITVAYAPHGVRDLEVHTVKNSFNLTGLRFESKALKKLGDAGALVVELHNEDFDTYASAINDWLEDEGIEVSRYDDGYTPHITVAYIDSETPSVDVVPLAFRAGGLSFSTPRTADKIPSLWAKHLAQRLSAQHYECAHCHYDFGPEPPNINLMKYCPGCGAATSKSKYNDTTGAYERVPTARLRRDPNQMTIQQALPTEIKAMPAEARQDFSETYAKRLTTGYDSLNNVLYVGPTGSYHEHTGRYFDVPMNEGEFDNSGTLNGPGWFVGHITLPQHTDSTTDLDMARDQGLLQGAKMGWYHRQPPNADELEKSVGITPAAEPQAAPQSISWADDDDDDDLGIDLDLDDDPGLTHPAIDSPSFATKSQAPVGTIFTVGADPMQYKIIENNGQAITVQKADGTGSTGQHEGQHEWPPNWVVKSVPQAQTGASYKVMGDIPNGSTFTTKFVKGKVYVVTKSGTDVWISDQANPDQKASYHYDDVVPSEWEFSPPMQQATNPKTLGDAPQGSLWQDGEDGPVYQLRHEGPLTYTKLHIDSHGEFQGPDSTEVPNPSGFTFPTAWIPFKDKMESPEDADDVWGQFPELTQVHYIYEPGVWTVVDVEDNTDPDREWSIENNVTKERKWVPAKDLKLATPNHPEFDGTKDEPQDEFPPAKDLPVDAEALANKAYDWQNGKEVKFHHGDHAYWDGLPVTIYSERINGYYIIHDKHGGETEVTEDELTPVNNPQADASSHKVGDYAYLKEGEDELDPDTTPYKIVSVNKGIVTAQDPTNGGFVEGPEDRFEKPQNEPEILAAQEAHGDPMNPSANVHAVFATTTDANKFRITPWTTWDDAQDQFNHHQFKAHVPYDSPSGGSQVKDKDNYPYNVAHYGVRSGDDPAYNTQPKGDINHPPQPFQAGQYVTVQTGEGSRPGVIVGPGISPGYWKVQFEPGIFEVAYQTQIQHQAPPNPATPGTFSRVLRRMGLRGPLAYHEPAEMPERAVSAPLMGIPVEYRQRLGNSKALEEHDAKVMAALTRSG